MLVPAEAVAAVARGQADILCVDLMQQSQDVLALLQASAKAKAEGRIVPVIVLAPLEATSRITACLKRGADDYLITPLDPEQPALVARRIENTIARYRIVASSAPGLGSEPTERIPIVSTPPPVPVHTNGKAGPEDQSYIHRFIPREFLDKLQRESLADVKLGDHAEHEMTVFFSDIRDFTFLSESLTPQQNFNFLTSYLKNVTPIIRKHGGFVDKYLGDGVMALFDGDAADAVASSVELQEQLAEYNRGRRLAGYVSIKVGMGLHRGKLMLGTIGAEDQMQTTVIADAVNLASRIEGMTKTFGVSMLLSSTVVAGLPKDHKYLLRCLGAVAAKGKTQSIDIYECFDNDEPELREHKIKTGPQFSVAMEEFRKGKLLTAGKIFARIAEFNENDSVAVYFRDRCSLSVISERDRGKSGWDGVEHLTVK